MEFILGFVGISIFIWILLLNVNKHNEYSIKYGKKQLEEIDESKFICDDCKYLGDECFAPDCPKNIKQ